jgi:predicted alpha/beta hydrolase
MGAQIAAGRDHLRKQRWKLIVKWHVVRPRLTALRGYFPGKQLGWVEAPPQGVVRDGRRFGSRAIKDAERDVRLAPFAGVTAPTLAVSVTDDAFGTRPAIARTPSDCPNSPAIHLRMAPAAIGQPAIGPCGCFHDRCAEALWPIALEWFQHARLPPGAPGVIVASRARRGVPAGASAAAAEGDG